MLHLPQLLHELHGRLDIAMVTKRPYQMRINACKRKCYYSRTSIKRPPFRRPPSIKRPFFKVPNCFSVYKLQYSIPLLNGQPLLSGQFLKSRGWPLNRGPTVLIVDFLFFVFVPFLGKPNNSKKTTIIRQNLIISKPFNWKSECFQHKLSYQPE